MKALTLRATSACVPSGTNRKPCWSLPSTSRSVIDVILCLSIIYYSIQPYSVSTQSNESVEPCTSCLSRGNSSRTELILRISRDKLHYQWYNIYYNDILLPATRNPATREIARALPSTRGQHQPCTNQARPSAAPLLSAFPGTHPDPGAGEGVPRRRELKLRLLKTARNPFYSPY